MFADIIVDISHEKLDRSFQYLVPKELEREIREGMVVTIPFGRGNQEIRGYVIGLGDTPSIDPDKMKSVLSLSSGEETTESRMIALAAWMKKRYGSTMIQALKTVLPFKEKVKAREKRYLVLNVSQEDARREMERLLSRRATARAKVLETLLESDRAEARGIPSSVINPLVEQGWIRVETDEVLRIPFNAEDYTGEENLPMTEGQLEAAREIRKEWAGENRPVLLWGVTGSGKTQVYMDLIDEVLSRGKQAIVLIPEIALTYQTLRRFTSRFGEKVSVMNSRLSQGERYDQFKRARKGEIQVMVGPRSALFTPFEHLGLIIMDEEHEPTYQSENSPRYHARETAVERARMEGASVILGSATPSLEAYSRALSGQYALVSLSERYGNRPLPKVSVVDLRQELRKGNRSVFSRQLQEAMAERLEKKEQTMLFLNRRGYAGFVSCRSCGHVMKCPHCDVSLSQHSNGKLVCHYCGYERPGVDHCPVCNSPYIGGFKAGTQQVEQVIKKILPTARVLRMDYDSTRSRGSYEKILSSFAAHEADILVGTQMIVKGHDFPDVTLVGVIAADLSLNAADYRCAERTFQLLTQAVGRSGRGRKTGEAIIQTYQPDHYSIIASARQDYQMFYRQEIAIRGLLDYPPCAHMLTVLAFGEKEENLIRGMDALKLYINRIYPGEDLHLIGPAPAAVGRVDDVYRRVMYLKHKEEKTLCLIRNKLEKYIEINPGYRDLYIQYDFS